MWKWIILVIYYLLTPVISFSYYVNNQRCTKIGGVNGKNCNGNIPVTLGRGAIKIDHSDITNPFVDRYQIIFSFCLFPIPFTSKCTIPTSLGEVYFSPSEVSSLENSQSINDNGRDACKHSGKTMSSGIMGLKVCLYNFPVGSNIPNKYGCNADNAISCICGFANQTTLDKLGDFTFRSTMGIIEGNSNRVIGCTPVIALPLPPIYNEIYTPLINAEVRKPCSSQICTLDNYINYWNSINSKFTNPALEIVFSIKDSSLSSSAMTTSIPQNVRLEYDSTKTLTSQVCKSIPSIQGKYCPKLKNGDICAIRVYNNDYENADELGCIPRPGLLQRSDIAVVSYYTNEKDIPAVQWLIIKDNNGQIITPPFIIGKDISRNGENATDLRMEINEDGNLVRVSDNSPVVCDIGANVGIGSGSKCILNSNLSISIANFFDSSSSTTSQHVKEFYPKQSTYTSISTNTNSTSNNSVTATTNTTNTYYSYQRDLLSWKDYGQLNDAVYMNNVIAAIINNGSTAPNKLQFNMSSSCADSSSPCSNIYVNCMQPQPPTSGTLPIVYFLLGGSTQRLHQFCQCGSNGNYCPLLSEIQVNSMMQQYQDGINNGTISPPSDSSSSDSDDTEDSLESSYTCTCASCFDDPNDVTSSRSVCPGIYNGTNDINSILPDQICLYASPDGWDFISGLNNPDIQTPIPISQFIPKFLCASLPKTCKLTSTSFPNGEIDYDNSDNVNNDETDNTNIQELNINEKLTIKCNAGYQAAQGLAFYKFSPPTKTDTHYLWQILPDTNPYGWGWANTDTTLYSITPSSNTEILSVTTVMQSNIYYDPEYYDERTNSWINRSNVNLYKSIGGDIPSNGGVINFTLNSPPYIMNNNEIRTIYCFLSHIAYNTSSNPERQEGLPMKLECFKDNISYKDYLSKTNQPIITNSRCQESILPNVNNCLFPSITLRPIYNRNAVSVTAINIETYVSDNLDSDSINNAINEFNILMQTIQQESRNLTNADIDNTIYLKQYRSFIIYLGACAKCLGGTFSQSVCVPSTIQNQNEYTGTK